MERLLLFAKVPRLGGVKTRLVPPLTPEQTLGLYRAFLQDQIGFVRSLAGGRDVELCLDAPWPGGPDGGSEPQGIRVTAQGSGDLGERLLRAFRRSRAEDSRATVVIAADSPTLPAAHVVDAFRRLADGAPAVIAPADDGGYVLLGMRDPVPELFREVRWSGDDVYETTCRRAAELELELARLPAWYDVDDIEGLRRLHAELARPETSRRAPETARRLRALASNSGIVL